jgi:hypothetical protein
MRLGKAADGVIGLIGSSYDPTGHFFKIQNSFFDRIFLK